jgi:hypothetical protein
MATDGLRLTIQLLQNINETITPVNLNGVEYRIESTPDTYPATFEIATTPIILVFIEDLTIDWVGKTETFNARITCYLGSTSEQIYDDLLQAGLLFDQNLIELYGALISPGGFYVLDYGTDTGYRIDIMSDPVTATGIRSDFQYTKEDIFYWGFSLTLPMQLTWGIDCD